MCHNFRSENHNSTQDDSLLVYCAVLSQKAVCHLHTRCRENQKPHKDILNSGNACYHSVQRLLSFGLLSSNAKVKPIILPVVSCGCQTWCLALREEHRLRVLENSVLRIIFVPKRNKITGEWRKFHSEKLYNLYSSPNIRQIKSRRMSWAEHIARMREKSVQCFGEKPRRKETARKTKT
jgi:hypothetical protein